VLHASHALAQSVTIDLSKPINVLTSTSVGFPAAMFTGDNFNIAGAPFLRTAGVTTPRYPGNHGTADLYHWSTKSLTKYKGADAGYLAPESNFASFVLTAEKLGSAVIVVNYGSNADGTGGGEPAEAAAWVAYANGDPSDTRPIVKDSTGTDWHTVGYWATIRSEAPLGAEDGYNFLRINHPKPFGFKLWQVGDQGYNNGYFGGEHVGNPDLHGPAPTGPKDFGKLKRDAKLAPAVYAGQLVAFANAMKAVDPTILIGAPLTTPPDGDKSMPEWNRGVLKAACPALDFVSLEWLTGGLVAPAYNTLNEDGLFADTRTNLSVLLNGVLDDYRGTCPKDHTPRIALSTASLQTWPKVERPVVKGLWAADTYALLIESGFVNVDWPEAYGDTMMSADHKKFGAAFYGLQMLHIVAHAPGDAFLDAKSSSPQVTVHATRRQDGIVGIMLVNTDPKAAANVKVSLKGSGVGVTGKRFDYGSAQFAQGAGPAASALTVSGNEFTITIPPYTVTDLLLPFVR
jgi:hypothetical protein